MNCSYVKLPGGGAAIVCGAMRSRLRKRCECGRSAQLLCDWKLGPKAIGPGVMTCDRPICPEHASEVGPDKHLCPEHQAAYMLWLQREGIAY